MNNSTMYIYRVLMNMEWDNMGLVTYNCDQEYSEEEINTVVNI